MKFTKKNLGLGYLTVLLISVILTIIMVIQWDPNNAVVMGCVIGVVWLFAIVSVIGITIEAKHNPYPFSYLVDRKTLVEYMEKEDKFSFDNNLEASFHFYIYLEEEKTEVQSWHYSASSSNSEKEKGDIYYWGKEEFSALESLINDKMKNLKEPILIELIESDSVMLNEYKASHPEWEVESYMENLKKK